MGLAYLNGRAFFPLISRDSPSTNEHQKEGGKHYTSTLVVKQKLVLYSYPQTVSGSFAYF